MRKTSAHRGAKDQTSGRTGDKPLAYNTAADASLASLGGSRDPFRLMRSAMAAIGVMLVLMPACALAGEPMRYIHHAPESSLDKRYDYQWEILRTALDRTS